MMSSRASIAEDFGLMAAAGGGGGVAMGGGGDGLVLPWEADCIVVVCPDRFPGEGERGMAVGDGEGPSVRGNGGTPGIYEMRIRPTPVDVAMSFPGVSLVP